MSSEVPEGWREVLLAECLEDFRNGFTYDTRALGGTMPITRIETISSGAIDYDRIGFALPDERLEGFRLEKDDILFSHINSVEHIAKVAMKTDERPLYHGMNLMRLRPNRRVDPCFLFARLQTNETRDHFRAVCKRAVNQVSLNKGEIGAYRFALPPLEEQRRIAEVLRSVDEAIAAAQRALVASETVHTCLLNDLFGVCVTALETTGTRTATIGGCCSRVTYGFTNPMPSTDEGPWLLTAANIRNGWIDYDTARHTSEEAYANLITEKSRPKLGSVLVTKDGTLGRVALVDKTDVCVNQSVAVLTPNEEVIDCRFLSYMLQSPSGQTRMLADSGGSSVKHIYISKLAEMEFGLPPLNVQRERATLAHESEQAVREQAQTVAAFVNTRAHVCTDLLSGRVRVPA